MYPNVSPMEHGVTFQDVSNMSQDLKSKYPVFALEFLATALILPLAHFASLIAS